ncbi:MAG: M28 family peptidase, partial [Flavisolibacter sp.]|nr:M28 family peptidase [Flavisolibacter sp.]
MILRKTALFVTGILVLSGCMTASQEKYFQDIENQRAKAYSKPKVNEKIIIDTAQLKKDLKIISHDSLEGRLPGSKGSLIARKYLTDRLQAAAIATFGNSYLQEFNFSRGTTEFRAANVIGFIRGTKAPEKYIVLSAHYDHLGIKNGKIFNGADDDASGVCGLLAMADYFSKNKPGTSIIFCFFDAEEKGLKGSYHFVDNPPVKLENITLNVNLDMISRNDKHDELIAAGTYYHPELRKLLAPLQEISNIALIFGYDQRGSKSGIEDWT